MGEISGANAAEQVSVCLSNLQAVCRAAQTDLARAVRITVYLTDMADFASVNEAYGAYFPSDPPARVAIGVLALPRGALVEVDAIVAMA